MLRERCNVCGGGVEGITINEDEVFRFCDDCITKWKNQKTKLIIEDLKTGDPQITFYECICGSLIDSTNWNKCRTCGKSNLFSLIQFNLRFLDLKYIFHNTLIYKRIDSFTTDVIISRVFGLKLKVEGSKNKLKEALDPETSEIILTRTCNWQLLSSLFEYFYPEVIPKDEENQKIEKHIKEIYNTERVTNEDIVRIVSEYEDINPRKIIINKNRNKKRIIYGDKVIVDGYGNKNLILKYLRSKMWDCPTNLEDRKSSKSMNQEDEMKGKNNGGRKRKVRGQKELPTKEQGVTTIHLEGGKVVITGHGEVDTSEMDHNNVFGMKVDQDTAPADVLRMARAKEGFTQRQLGERVGISGKTIGAYEASRCMIREDIAERLGEVLNVPSEFLIV